MGWAEIDAALEPDDADRGFVWRGRRWRALPAIPAQLVSDLAHDRIALPQMALDVVLAVLDPAERDPFLAEQPSQRDVLAMLAAISDVYGAPVGESQPSAEPAGSGGGTSKRTTKSTIGST